MTDEPRVTAIWVRGGPDLLLEREEEKLISVARSLGIDAAGIRPYRDPWPSRTQNLQMLVRDTLGGSVGTVLLLSLKRTESLALASLVLSATVESDARAIVLHPPIDTETPRGLEAARRLIKVAELGGAASDLAVASGVERARREGRNRGRPPVPIDQDVRRSVLGDLGGRLTIREIAARRGLPAAVVRRIQRAGSDALTRA